MGGFGGCCGLGLLGGMGGSGWLGLVLGLVLPLVLIAGLVLLIVLALRRAGGQGSGIGGTGRSVTDRFSATDILEQRYARGEIDREQFLAMRSDLG